MAILAFQKPDKVVMLEADDKFGKFEFRPLEPGFGVTIATPCDAYFFHRLRALPSIPSKSAALSMSSLQYQA